MDIRKMQSSPLWLDRYVTLRSGEKIIKVIFIKNKLKSEIFNDKKS